MGVPIYYIDAFTDRLFSGNPAAVIFSQLNDEKLMQNIAAENNLSETAFIREENDEYHIRWFAPLCEMIYAATQLLHLHIFSSNM